MKKSNKKSLVLLIAAALLLTITVSGTVAYLVDSTGNLVNTFTPTEVNTTIDEDFDSGDTEKKDIKIVNSNSEKDIPVYIRVALVGNWYDSTTKQIVDSWSPSFTHNSNLWYEGIDGFYYYRYIVDPGESTTDLLNGTSIQGNVEGHSGQYLEVTVIQQSIQATPKDAVTEAWGTTVANNLFETTKPTT